jgi:hypothetical protein
MAVHRERSGAEPKDLRLLLLLPLSVSTQTVSDQ